MVSTSFLQNYQLSTMAYNLKCLKFALVLSTSFVNMNSISFHQLIGPNGVTKHTMNISLSNLKKAIYDVMLLCVLLEWLTFIQVFIFESLNFRILESWDNFIGLYFNGTKSNFLNINFHGWEETRNPQKFEPYKIAFHTVWEFSIVSLAHLLISTIWNSMGDASPSLQVHNTQVTNFMKWKGLSEFWEVTRVHNKLVCSCSLETPFSWELYNDITH